MVQTTARRVEAARIRTPATVQRFETLDSWRGICALMVALMHFPVSGPIGEAAVVRGAYLFVDYFFVLSGFVIAHGYGRKITDGASYLRFLVLRTGRIYPLHVAVLGLFVGFEVLRILVPALRGDGAAPFTGENSLSALVSNLLFLNGMGVEDSLTWNGPSWSISAEMWTYVLFGVSLLLLRQRLWIALVAAVLVCPLILYLYAPHYMDATYDFGFVRCVYGFSLGVLLHGVIGHRPVRLEPTPNERLVWTLAELAAVAVVVGFVSFSAHNAAGFAAPLLFAVVLAVFVPARGLVSRLLRMRLFLWLGTLSYGIYMLHIFVQSRLINAGTLFGSITGTELVGPFQINGVDYFGFGVQGPAFGTLMAAVMVVAVVVAAWIGYVVVERPFLRWSRQLVAASEPKDNPPARKPVSKAAAGALSR